MRIRRAGRDDLAALIEIGRQAMAEQDHLAPWNEVDGVKWIEDELTNGRVILALDDNHIAGTVGFHVEPFPWNTTQSAVAVKWFYVLPDFRRTDAAQELADTLKIAASQLPVLFPVMWGGRVKAKTRLFERLGFRQIGGMFMIEG